MRQWNIHVRSDTIRCQGPRDKDPLVPNSVVLEKLTLSWQLRKQYECYILFCTILTSMSIAFIASVSTDLIAVSNLIRTVILDFPMMNFTLGEIVGDNCSE